MDDGAGLTPQIGKVFGIGLSKTGTTSLTRALRMLGYKAVHFPIYALRPAPQGIALDARKIRRPEALTDAPLPRFYKEADAAFPGSKFILTVRNMDPWLKSCEKSHVWPGQYVHDKLVSRQPLVRALLDLHHQTYGSVWFDREAFKASYERHLREVKAYFLARKADLLIMDVCGGEGWEKLCPFLGRPVPSEPFPRANEGRSILIKRETRRWFWQAVSLLHLGRTVESRHLPLTSAPAAFRPLSS